jgi:TolB protein
MIKKILSFVLICLFLVGAVSCDGETSPSPTTTDESPPASQESKPATTSTDPAQSIPAGSPTVPKEEKTGPPPGELLRLGDFSIAISEINREENKAILYFAITKVDDKELESQPLPVVLVDDHGNEYKGQLNINLRGASKFVLSALPKGFTYVDLLEINMPKLAPIKRIILSDKDTAYEKIKFGVPQFTEEFSSLAIVKDQSVSLGEWFSFTMKQVIPESPSWKLPFRIDNKEYNPLPAEVRVGVQNRDGTISWSDSKSADIPAQSGTMVSVSLPLKETPPQPRMLILEYIDQKSQESALRLYSMPPGKLLPFAVSADIFQKWKEGDYELGLPTENEESVVSAAEDSNTTAQLQNFEGGQVYHIISGSDAGQSFEIHSSPLMDVHNSAKWLGFPVMDEQIAASGHTQAEFEAGYIATTDGKTFQAYRYPAGRIAFVSDRDGNEEIYVTDSSGRSQTNLTNDPANDWSPTWSPDGQKIAFVSDRQPQGIYVMNADGTNQRFLTEGDAPSWFPDGSKIVFTKPGTYVAGRNTGKQEGAHSLKRIYSIKIDGADLKEIVVDSNTANVKDFAFLLKQHFAKPTISPSGSEIAFAIGKWESGWSYSIHLMNIDGTGLRRLNLRSDEPSWSPDGKTIAHRGDNGYLHDIVGHGGPLHTAIPSAVPDSDRVDLYFTEKSKIQVFGGLDWASDGLSIVFSEIVDKNIRLRITHADEQISRPLPGKGNNYHPVWTLQKNR